MMVSDSIRHLMVWALICGAPTITLAQQQSLPPTGGAPALEVTVDAQSEAKLPEDVGIQADRLRLKKMIDKKVERLAEETVPGRMVAEAHKLDWPICLPTHSAEEIRAMTDKELAEALAQQFPESKLKEEEAAIRAANVVFVINAPIEFDLKNRRGRVQGKLYRIELPTRIRVGDRNVPGIDIPDEVLDRLDATRNAKVIAEQITTATRQFNTRKALFQKDEYEAILARNYRASGYVEIPSRSGKASEWISIKALYEDVLGKERQAASLRLRPGVEAEVYKANGYEQFQDEWLPKAKAEELRAMQKVIDDARNGESSQPPTEPQPTPPQSMAPLPGMLPPSMPPGMMMPPMIPPKAP